MLAMTLAYNLVRGSRILVVHKAGVSGRKQEIRKSRTVRTSTSSGGLVELENGLNFCFDNLSALEREFRTDFLSL